MEIPVLVDVAGTVESVNVEGGDVVQEGDVLVSLSVDGSRGGAS
jgi:biotin carboxyl carrier protein